jgi:uncharacterized protein YjbI with pentapeptide repeats
MKIIKPLTLGILQRPYTHRGRHRLAIAALGFFPLGQGTLDRLLADNLQWARLAPTLAAGLPLDHVLPKARSEVLLSGTAYSVKPVQSLCVRLQCGPVDKCLQVIGERNWQRRWWSGICVDAPKPFQEMPLTWERAYGGASHDNPVGCGYLPRFGRARRGLMPNVEYPGLPVMPGRRQMPAACLAPRELLHADQARRASGTYDKRWLAEDFPGLPRDFDFGLFNLSSPDQQFASPLAGNETYCLENLHARQPKLAGTLPGLQTRAFIVREGQEAAAAEEVMLVCDTVWFFPDIDIGMLVFRGATLVSDSDALDVQTLMVAYERLGEARPLAHYREVMALRTDAASAPLHAFNESQLAPPLGPAELAVRLQRRQWQIAAAQAERQALLDEQMAAFWQESGITPPADHVPPQVGDPLLDAPSADELASGEFALAEIQAQAQALAAKARADVEGHLAAEQARLQATLAERFPGVDFSEQADIAELTRTALAKAGEAAHDLLGTPASAAMPEKLTETLAHAESAQPGSIDPAQRAEIDAAMAKLAAVKPQQRAARIAAVTPTVTALPAEAARALGAQVRQWLREGVPLAGRDLAGADLAGIDLGGADLREVQLEHANLCNARLAGANLAKAVLTGACLDGADLHAACLDGANLCGSWARAADFRGASLRAARAIDAQWQSAQLQGATLDDMLALRIDLTAACLDDVNCARTVLAEARAAGSQWRNARWQQTVAGGAQFAQADFSAATLERSVLLDAQLQKSNWHAARLAGVYAGGKADWSGASLAGASLRRCGLHGASLRGADLSGGQFAQCDFGEADLSDARLEDARLYRSLFMRSRLRRVSAARADFFQALCRKADFSQAQLADSVLVQADTSEARWDGAECGGALIDRKARIA